MVPELQQLYDMSKTAGSQHKLRCMKNAMEGPACGSSGVPFRPLCLESSDASESKPSSSVDWAAHQSTMLLSAMPNLCI